MNSPAPLILASASPRRRELLANLGVEFSVLPADIDETPPDTIDDPAAFARELAETKARHVAGGHSGAAVLAADTIVVFDNQILGKPVDVADAKATLQQLRNRPHEVTTAIALACGSTVRVDHATTGIVMRDYSDKEIDAYIASGDPFDKAGSYAIQHEQFRPVERYEGCYCNVVGLPIILTRQMLQEPGLSTTDLPADCRTCPVALTR